MPLPPFQVLLDGHGRDVHRFLIACVGSVDADDCYQETWLAALRAYPRLTDDSNLRSWILTIAHRKAIDHLRSRRRRAIPVGETPEPDGAVGFPAGARASEPVKAAEGGVWGHVATLPAKQRTALALRFIADADYGEIAEVMQSSEVAARRNVHEALKRLRKDYRP